MGEMSQQGPLRLGCPEKNAPAGLNDQFTQFVQSNRGQHLFQQKVLQLINQ